MIQLRILSVICALLLTAAFGQPFWGEYKVPAAGGGPDTYYYTTGWTASTTGTAISGGWAPQSYAYGNEVVVGQAGTATEIGMRMTTGSGAGIAVKMALYNSSGNLVANGTGTVTSTGGLGAWVNVAINASVSAATYYVHVSAATSDGWSHYVSGATDGNAIAVAYASFPQASATIDVESGNNFGARIYVD